MRFQDTPIRRKLTTMILGTSAVVLLLTCAGFIGYEVLTFRKSALRELSTLGEIIAAQSTAAVAFDNQRDATEILSALKAERHIVAAALYDKQGRLFSRYPSDAPDHEFPASPLAPGYRFEHGELHGFTPLVQVAGADQLGTLYLSSDLEAMSERLRLYALIALLVIAVSLTVAYTLSHLLQRQISGPLLALAQTARAVSERRDYSVRASKHGADEIGLLTDAFNQMLVHIQEQNALLENRVRERTAELEAANDELEAFCSSAAHDLRTPLRAIIGLTDVLLDERATHVPPEVRHSLGSIRAGSTQMSQLINDLLSFSRLGRQELSRHHVSAVSACEGAVQDLANDRRGREIELRIGPLPEVFADPALLRVVFVNLLSNAFKYSRDRRPAIVEVGTTTVAGEATPAIFVRDNGVGFDLNNAAKLFGVFQRLHHAHEFEGTGVGLATVRRIIERHGGRIWPEAAPDQGATFYFTLPVGP
jgi:signal transduction histidine kinase